MIARDASNFQKRNEIATGIAFCTEKTVTTTMMANTIIKVIIFFSFRVALARYRLAHPRTRQKSSDPEVYLAYSMVIRFVTLFTPFMSLASLVAMFFSAAFFALPYNVTTPLFVSTLVLNQNCKIHCFHFHSSLFVVAFWTL